MSSDISVLVNTDGVVLTLGLGAWARGVLPAYRSSGAPARAREGCLCPRDISPDIWSRFEHLGDGQALAGGVDDRCR